MHRLGSIVAACIASITLCVGFAAADTRATAAPPGWRGPFADFGATTAWTRPVPQPAPTAEHSAAWVRVLFAPPGRSRDRDAFRFAGRLQFCTRAAYLGTHTLRDGGRAVGSRGCAAGDSGTTVVFAARDDPLVTVSCYEYGPGCNAEHAAIRIPPHVTANANSDHHLAVIDAAAARECDFWETGWLGPDRSSGFVDAGDALAVGNGGCGSLRGDGSGRQWQATGAQVPLSAGVLRAADVLGPSGDGSDGQIAHALYASLWCTAHEHEYPASTSDGGTPGCAPEGSRLFLTTAGLAKFERARPPIPNWERTIVRAYHTYGLIVSDRGGEPFALSLEDDAGAIAFGRPAPWSQTFIDFAKSDPATARANIDLSIANDVYHVDLEVPPDVGENDWAFAAPCVNRGTCPPHAP